MELLTGQTKEKFNNWFLQNYYTDVNGIITDKEKLSAFKGLNFAMQYGVYINFFDSIEIQIFIKGYKFFHEPKEYYFIICNEAMIHLNNHVEDRFNTRFKTQIESIKRANKIYNNGKK